METKIVSSKFVIAIIIFFVVCIFGCIADIHAKTLSAGKEFAEDKVRLKLVSIENETDTLEFQIFYHFDNASAYVFPHSTFEYQVENAIGLNPYSLLIVKCSKGTYLPVFVQDGGYASGEVEDGYDGPFYITMWLNLPSVAESNKTHIRYVVKKGEVGKIGLKIGNNGDYRFVAHENMKFLA